MKKQLLHIMEEAALAAGALLRAEHGSFHETTLKTDQHDVLTKLDIASQNIICSTLSRGMKKIGVPAGDIGFLGEENLYAAAKYLFVIDPLDGTSNFASGSAFFSISIACFQEGELIAGIVYQPVFDIFYMAEKGGGAYRKIKKQTEKLQVAQVQLAQACITIDLPLINSKISYSHSPVASLYQQVRALRILGSTALETAQIAANELQASVFSKIHIWDIAASMLILEEAGGAFWDWHGKKLIFDVSEPERIYNFIAGHPETNKKLSKIVRENV